MWIRGVVMVCWIHSGQPPPLPTHRINNEGFEATMTSGETLSGVIYSYYMLHSRIRRFARPERE